ncbi:unnamed protein product, partial [Ectocarpus fasciculatus]
MATNKDLLVHSSRPRRKMATAAIAPPGGKEMPHLDYILYHPSSGFQLLGYWGDRCLSVGYTHHSTTVLTLSLLGESMEQEREEGNTLKLPVIENAPRDNLQKGSSNVCISFSFNADPARLGSMSENIR